MSIRQLKFAGKALYLIEEKISFRNPFYPCFVILFLLQKAFHCIQEIARFFNPFWQHSSNIFSARGRSLHNIEAGRSFYPLFLLVAVKIFLYLAQHETCKKERLLVQTLRASYLIVIVDLYL